LAQQSFSFRPKLFLQYTIITLKRINILLQEHLDIFLDKNAIGNATIKDTVHTYR